MTNAALITLGAFALVWLGYEIKRHSRTRYDGRIRWRDWTHYRDR